jgi:hypothetical protein
VAIDRNQLARHIEDYNQRCNSKVKRFVCPITLRECEEHELINAHILNKSLVNASRRTVIQYGDVDHFYGSRVEASFVDYLNLVETSRQDFIRYCDKLTVRFSDGKELEAFVAEGAGAKRAAGKFPLLPLRHEGKDFIPIFVKTKLDDPRLAEGRVEIIGTDLHTPSHWVASMLKAGLLSLFDMIGYRAIFDPFGDSLRRTLARYYYDKAKPSDSGKYFAGYRNATKVFLRPNTADGGKVRMVQFEFDTLNDRQVLLHYTPSETLFAATCFFRVNRGSISVTVPQTIFADHVDIANTYYDRLMRDEKAIVQKVMRVEFTGNTWKPLEQVNFAYFDRDDFEMQVVRPITATPSQEKG